MNQKGTTHGSNGTHTSTATRATPIPRVMRQKVDALLEVVCLHG